jgi:hypothetical protein
MPENIKPRVNNLQFESIKAKFHKQKNVNASSVLTNLDSVFYDFKRLETVLE